MRVTDHDLLPNSFSATHELPLYSPKNVPSSAACLQVPTDSHTRDQPHTNRRGIMNLCTGQYGKLILHKLTEAEPQSIPSEL